MVTFPDHRDAVMSLLPDDADIMVLSFPEDGDIIVASFVIMNTKKVTQTLDFSSGFMRLAPEKSVVWHFSSL
jgi:hypothetical protein